MKAYWMILGVFFFCTGFGTSWQNEMGSNSRTIASESDASVQEMQATLCEQNQTISQLESRIEELIAESQATLAAAEEVAEEEQTEEEAQEEEQQLTTQYVFNPMMGGGDQMNGAFSMMLFQLFSQQAAQNLQLQTTLATMQAQQTLMVNNQNSMMTRLDQAFNRPIPQFPMMNLNYYGLNAFNNGQNLAPSVEEHDPHRRESQFLMVPRQDFFHFMPEPNQQLLERAPSAQATLPQTTEV